MLLLLLSVLALLMLVMLLLSHSKEAGDKQANSRPNTMTGQCEPTLLHLPNSTAVVRPVV